MGLSKISSRLKDKKIQEIQPQKVNIEYNLKDIIIPFSAIQNTEKFIYYGQEKIPFRERHPVYQTLLRNEFKSSLKRK